MGEILRRIGFVIVGVIASSIVGAIATLLFGLGKALLVGGGPIGGDGAFIMGVGFFGAFGGFLFGPIMGREYDKSKGRTPSRAADVASWIVGIAAGIACFSVLIQA